MNQNLVQSARKLRLSGLLPSLELRLQEATTHQLPPEQFLELVFQDELNVRQQRVIDKRTKAAGFRDHKTLEDFDWTFNPAIKRQQMYELLFRCAEISEVDGWWLRGGGGGVERSSSNKARARG
jgi:DNA replication protein DnaC